MPYPDSAAGGVSITTTSQYYISYPLSALPGGAASLANKTVTIELMSSPTTNNATILDM